ncbi:MAG: response regulator [Desulfofustis sp.]|jgi:two-component system chemotaxis response regulator CheY|nr:response regulator [Desulfofustis sp.]
MTGRRRENNSDAIDARVDESLEQEARMGKNVLLVDDSSTMRKIIGRSLRQAGISFDNIFEAGDGLEALAILEKERVDIVLSDINMPNMDGISFLREKSVRDDIKDIPVLMISTETGDDIIGEAKSLGAVGAIKKPFTPDKVNEILGPLL